MSDLALFPESDAYDGDPLRPDMDVPTPASIVATLTGPEREQRVRWLIGQAYDIYDAALDQHLGKRLCGAYAKPGELDNIRLHFPHIAAQIERLERRVAVAILAGELDIDLTYAKWGHGLGKPSGSGRLCSSCDDRLQMALEIPA